MAGSAAIFVGWLSGFALLRPARRQRYRSFLSQLHGNCHRPWTVLLLVAAMFIALPMARLSSNTVRSIDHGLLLFTICVAAWLVVKVLFVAEDTAFRLFPIDVPNNRRVRRMRTRITLLRRLTG